MIRLPIKRLCSPNIELIISYILGSEPSFRVMAVAVAVRGPKDITFILCVSTSQDTVSCKVSIFLHWIYCFQQKIPLPDATTSWWGEKSQQAKCQGTCPSSLCISSVTWFTGSFSKGKRGRSASLTNSKSSSGISFVPLTPEAAEGWASPWQRLGQPRWLCYRYVFRLLLNLPWSPDFTSCLVSSWEHAWGSLGLQRSGSCGGQAALEQPAHPALLPYPFQGLTQPAALIDAGE